MARRRLATLAALALAVMASASGVASADQQIIVTIPGDVGEWPSPEQTTVGALESPESPCPTYPGPVIGEYGPGGVPTGDASGPGGWTIATLLTQCLPTPIPLDDITGVTVFGDDESPQTGPNSLLTPDDLATPSDFANPQESPLLTSDGDGVEYWRPWRAGTDDNAADEVQITAPSPFKLEVFTGPLLTVTVSAPSSAEPNTAVSLQASVTQHVAGFTYAWNFDGGSPAPGDSTVADPSVTFAAPGTYQVTVEVSDASGSVGVGSAIITVGSGTSTTATGPTTGPVTSTATTTTATAPPASTTTTPATTTTAAATTTATTPAATTRQKHHRRAKRAKRPRKRHARPQAATKKSSRTSPPPTKPVRSTTTRSPKTATVTSPAPAATETPAATGTPPTHTTAARVPVTTTETNLVHRPRPLSRRRPRPTPRPNARPQVTPRSTSASPRAAIVEGRLISSITPLPVDSSPLVRQVPAATVSAPPLRRLPGRSLLGALAAGLAVVLLIGLGATRELRWRRIRSGP